MHTLGSSFKERLITIISLIDVINSGNKSYKFLRFTEVIVKLVEESVQEERKEAILFY